MDISKQNTNREGRTVVDNNGNCLLGSGWKHHIAILVKGRQNVTAISGKVKIPIILGKSTSIYERACWRGVGELHRHDKHLSFVCQLNGCSLIIMNSTWDEKILQEQNLCKMNKSMLYLRQGPKALQSRLK